MTRVWTLALTAALSLWAVTAQAQAPAASTPSANYIIGPGDTLKVFVWSHEDLSVVVPVRPDGRISTPLVEDLVAQDRNPTDLARDIEKALSKYTRDPVVTVVVTTFVGAAGEQIRVIGEATKPAAIPYRQKMTVLDVMIAVGGLTDFADGNAAVLVRAKEEGKSYGVRLRDLIKRGDISANVDVRPGDVLIIPQSWF